MSSSRFIIAVFIGVLSFIALAVLGLVAPAGTGVDWTVSAIGGAAMALVAYFILGVSKKYRALVSVLFGLTLVAVLILGFNTQVPAALLTGLIGGMITYIIYPVVVGKRSLLVKLGVVAVAALILIAVFAVVDPVIVNVGTTTAYVPGYYSAPGQPANAYTACTATPPYISPQQLNPQSVFAGQVMNLVLSYDLVAANVGGVNYKATADIGWRIYGVYSDAGVLQVSPTGAFSSSPVTAASSYPIYDTTRVFMKGTQTTYVSLGVAKYSLAIRWSGTVTRTFDGAVMSSTTCGALMDFTVMPNPVVPPGGCGGARNRCV